VPRGDRTGPLGLGPRTGRGAGYCGGHKMPGFMNPCQGRGFGAASRGGFAGGLPGRAGAYGASPYGFFGLPGFGFGRELGLARRRGRGWCRTPHPPWW
jgi:hypothetical protein